MSERELSTILREHLADEPPVGVTSLDAIRAGRRQRHVRLGLAGAAGAAVLAVAVAALPGLVDGDQPGTARDAASAPPEGVPVPDTLESLAESEVAPYVGALGAPTWDIVDVDGQAVEPADADAQFFELGYEPAGSALVQLHVAGYAPEEFDTYAFGSTCQDNDVDGFSVSCEQETLADGSTIISSVAPYTDVTNTTKRLVTVAQARKHPGKVLWARSFSISTRDGVTAGVSEFVRAQSPETAAWLVPVEVLREIATDPDLLNPAAVAHTPFPEITGG
jgi:hypothetical protein